MDAVRPAGFWIRAVALIIDFALFFFVQVSYGFVAGMTTGVAVKDAWTLTPMLWTFTLIFTAAYTTALHAGWGQTLGKLIVGVRVVDLDGEPPRIGAALLRYIGYFASIVTMFLGYVMAGLRSDKRALHDLIAGTRVERVDRITSSAPTGTASGDDTLSTSGEQLDLPPA